MSFTHDNGKHYFAVVNTEGGVQFRSEGYSSVSSRDNGAASFLKNAANPARFSTEENRNLFYVVVKAGNGQEIARSLPLHTQEEAAQLVPAAVAAEEAAVVEAPAPVVAEAIVAEAAVAAPVAARAAIIPDEVTEEEDEPIDDLVIDEAPAAIGSAHDDFDWARGKRGQILYNDSDRTDLMTQYDNSMKSLIVGEIVKGRVSAITGNDVVLDISYKSDGLLAVGDFRDIPDLKIGDYVDVYVESQEDAKGQLQLSRRKAKLLRAWEAIVDSFQNGTVIRGTVIS